MRFSEKIIWSPLDYAEAAVVARAAAEEMLSRLSLVTIQPKVILDAGCGTGEMGLRLQALYPEAQVLALDSSESMLAFCAGSNSCHPAAKTAGSSPYFICADALSLPLPAQSVDLIFANFLLPWQADFKSQLQEWRRVLRPGGLLIFTALGLDTLRELRPVLPLNEMPALVDMHDLGDELLHQQFEDPIVDVDYTTLVYQSHEKLMFELQASGMCPPDAVIPSKDGIHELTFEVIYAHVWRPLYEKQTIGDDQSIRIPLSHLRSRHRL